MDADKYIQRLRYTGPREPSLEVLRKLQRAHLSWIPFENLDIHLGRPLSLQLDSLFDKIVERRRGGFCYELNGLFAWLLRELGFGVELLSARVRNDAGHYGPPFDHMALRVAAEGRFWLVDVGFGDGFVEPLWLDTDAVQTQSVGTFRIVADGTARRLDREVDSEWVGQFTFDLIPHDMDEYEPMCVYHQTSPDSTFLKRRICTKLFSSGRLTLADLTFIETRGGERHETQLDEAGWERHLREFFGIELHS